MKELRIKSEECTTLEARPPQRFFLAAPAVPLALRFRPLPFFPPTAFSSAKRSCSSSVFSAF